MGHQRLGILPATRQWKAVIALITGGADARHIAAAAAAAAKSNLREASKDPALRHAFWLLARIPLAARQADFGESLRALDLKIGNTPNLIEIGAAMTAAIGNVRCKERRSGTLAEIACKAATTSLVAVASRSETACSASSMRRTRPGPRFAGCRPNRQFGVLARDFIGRLTRSCLDYFLSRAMPDACWPKQAVPEHPRSPRVQ